MSETEFSALKIDDGKNWTFHCYYSQSSQVIGFSPKAPENLNADGSISLALNPFTMANKPTKATVQLNVYYFRVGGVTKDNNPLAGNFGVNVTYPPDQHKADLHTAIQATLDPTEVVNSPEGSPLQNALTLVFSQVPPAVVQAGPDTEFILTFIYADDKNGFGAMMTRAEAQPPFAVAQGQNASGWGITSYPSDKEPYWTLKPPTGQPIVGTGVQSTVSFQITSLATTFQPGPTIVSISYRGIPGYQEGSFALLVEKLPHVEISSGSFQVVPAQSTLTNGEVSVTLSWTALNATALTLTPPGQDVSGSTSFPTQIAATTDFTLIAEGQRPGNVDNRAFAKCTATVIPPPDVRAWFEPDSVPYGKSVVLKWSSNDADGIYFFTGETDKKTLGKAPDPDPKNQVTVQPEYGINYSAQAFRRKSDGSDQLSKVYQLAFTFAPIEMSFKAEPTSFKTDGGTLSWNVVGAKAVTLQQQPVNAVDSQKVVPQDDTTYELAATWVDGEKFTKSLRVPVLKVQVTKVEARGFKVDRSQSNFLLVAVTIVFHVNDATGGRFHCSSPGQSQDGPMWRESSTQWTAFYSTTISPAPTFSFPFDYSFQGDLLLPATGSGEINETGVKWIGR